MRINFITYILLLILFSSCNLKKEKSKKSEIQTNVVSYFGQSPPNMEPVIFAPNIVSINGRNEYGISFSPSLDELYFSASKNDSLPVIYFSELENGKWTLPTKISFTKGIKDAEMHPFVDLKNDKIYFTAHNTDYTDTKIWYVNRLENSWSDAEKLNSPINDDEVFYLNQSNNGDFFYTNISKFKIFYASKGNEKLDEVKDTRIEFGIHGFISPEQDYLLLNARHKENKDRKDNDIYVCFKKENGEWTNPINLGTRINTTYDETCPSLTPDGKYLLFSRYNEENELSNFYWVSSEVIKELNPINLEN